MKYTKLTVDWNADPNSPLPTVAVQDDTLTLDFYLNYFLYDRFKEEDKGCLTFYNCHKYYLGRPNDEGYFRGQHRYKPDDLPYGDFYLLDTDWPNDFPQHATVLNANVHSKDLKHYIFFFRDDTFECIAENYELKFLPA